MAVCLQCEVTMVGSGHLLCPKCSLISRAKVTSTGKMVKISIVPRNPVPSEFPDKPRGEPADYLEVESIDESLLDGNDQF